MNDDPLESDLRAAFAARFASVAPERELRLRAYDYRSPTTRRRRLWAAMGTGATALTGGVVATILMLSSGASVAEGWTPVPSAPSSAALAAAAESCNRAENQSGPPVMTGTPVLAEARGSYTAAIYVSGQAAYICIANGHKATHVAMKNLLFDAAPGPNQLGDPSGFGGGAAGFPGSASSAVGSERDVSGLAGSDVSAVTFGFADGSTVEATVENGWYFAWWPGDRWPTSAQVTTGSGTLTSPMSVAACQSRATDCVFAGPNPNIPPAR